MVHQRRRRCNRILTPLRKTCGVHDLVTVGAIPATFSQRGHASTPPCPRGSAGRWRTGLTSGWSHRLRTGPPRRPLASALIGVGPPERDRAPRRRSGRRRGQGHLGPRVSADDGAVVLLEGHDLVRSIGVGIGVVDDADAADREEAAVVDDEARDVGVLAHAPEET